MEPADDHIDFEGFSMDRRRRVLTAGGQTVALQARAFALLDCLVQRRDRDVERDEIIAVVWQGLSVTEKNLTTQMSNLRRELGRHGGADLVTTVPKGYRFVGDVVRPSAPVASLPVMDAGATAIAVASPVAWPGRPWRPRWVILAAWFGAAALAAYPIVRHWEAKPAPRLSISVLPFASRGADPDDASMADAITDDLTTDLAHLPNSVVIARASAEAYRGQAIPAIGKALGVRYVLQGSLRHEDGNVHVDAQLADATNGHELWTLQFDVTRAMLEAARTEIVGRLAAALDDRLVSIEARRSLHDRPDNPDAMDFYLRARSVVDRDSSLAGLTKGQLLFEKAVRAAPDFVDARARLAIVLLDKLSDSYDAAEWEDHAEAAEMIARAVALAPNEAIVIAARGKLAWMDYRCSEAAPDFRLALSLDPDLLTARTGLAACAYETGRMQEAIDTLTDLSRIDPASTDDSARANSVGMSYLFLGDATHARDWLNRARTHIGQVQGGGEVFGWQEWNSAGLIAANWIAGDHVRAASLLADYRQLWPHRTIWQLDSFLTHAMTTLPGHARFVDALKAAGMPAFADETADLNASGEGSTEDDFRKPTPGSILNGTRIDTAAMRSILKQGSPQQSNYLVLDLGRGAATIPGALLVWPLTVWGDPDALLDRAAAAAMPGGGRYRQIVVMGDGTLDWTCYEHALRMIRQKQATISWYRGGEEAWAASGGLSVDKRPQ